MSIKKNKSTLDNICALSNLLNKASALYYNTGNPCMSDADYDMYYERLKELEGQTGYILSNSPTQKIGAGAVSLIPKVRHKYPMLSLDKCHSVKDIQNFAKTDDCFISLKLDGLSVRLVYKAGQLVGIYKRGDGQVGNDVTHLSAAFGNIPKNIGYKKDFIVDGEAIITYRSFEDYNKKVGGVYKNPRNLASGTLSLLDVDEAKGRGLQFVAWRVIKGLDNKKANSVHYRLMVAEAIGFTIVPSVLYSAIHEQNSDLDFLISRLKQKAKDLSYPIDGIVVAKDNIAIAEALGRTNKFYRHSLAYKFDDNTIATKLRCIEWSIGQTGILTPIAVFEPVKIEGTVVEKASVHNISIMRTLGLKIGCICYVKKANMIIPQIQKCEHSGAEEKIVIPTQCPYCGCETVLINNDHVETLHCRNKKCIGKEIKRLSRFVSKQGMDINGLSESTIEKYVNAGWIHRFSDIYKLYKYEKWMAEMQGFGRKSVDKILKSIALSKKCMLDKFICSLSIPTIGQSQSKILAENFNYNCELFYKALIEKSDFSHIDGFGENANINIHKWFGDIENQKEMRNLMNIINFCKPHSVNASVDLADKTFVITGKLSHFKNRNELKQMILSAGGKVSNSVSKNTYALVNNNIKSNSSKNQKAKELGVKILCEKDMMSILNV